MMNLPQVDREPRISIQSINLPFLGTSEDHTPFQYLLLDISQQGVKIAMPRWVVSRETLHEGTRVHLHAPFRVGDRLYAQGQVRWAKWDESMQSQVCGIQIEENRFLHYSPPIYLEPSGVHIDLGAYASIQDLLARTIQDAALLKRGVLIYLNHLIPYFSRIGDYPHKEYPKLKETFLKDMTERVEAHRAHLDSLRLEIRQNPALASDIVSYLDLEELREWMESEIPMGIMEMTFESEAAKPYLVAIKELEKRLYANYNALVMLFLRALSTMAPSWKIPS